MQTSKILQTKETMEPGRPLKLPVEDWGRNWSTET